MGDGPTLHQFNRNNSQKGRKQATQPDNRQVSANSQRMDNMDAALWTGAAAQNAGPDPLKSRRGTRFKSVLGEDGAEVTDGGVAVAMWGGQTGGTMGCGRCGLVT